MENENNKVDFSIIEIKIISKNYNRVVSLKCDDAEMVSELFDKTLKYIKRISKQQEEDATVYHFVGKDKNKNQQDV